MKKEKQKVMHEFDAYYNKNSKILILGSIPSVKSREYGFYYMHPQNKFWKVLAEVYQDVYPETIEEKKEFLKRHQIALWDVLSSCEIKGSSDSSIKNPIPNDIDRILKESSIKQIYTTGKTATKLYEKYCYPQVKRKSIYLPSTSPANIGNYSFEKLVEEYKILLEERDDSFEFIYRISKM